VKQKPSRQPEIGGIRAGNSGNADSLFLVSGLIALEDDSMGDLSAIENDRQSFRKLYLDVHPGCDAGGGAKIAGKFFSFCSEIAVGDYVVYYRLLDRRYHFAVVKSKYSFIPKRNPDCAHVRKIDWIGSIEKDKLSVSAQREPGAARTFFKISRHSTELTSEINKITQAGSATST
jgi:restriction system protein